MPQRHCRVIVSLALIVYPLVHYIRRFASTILVLLSVLILPTPITATFLPCMFLLPFSPLFFILFLFLLFDNLYTAVS